MVEPGTLEAAGRRIEQLEAELRATHRLAGDLIDRAPHGIVIHHDGVFSYTNQAARELLGLAADERAEGRRILDFVHPSSRADFLARIALITREGMRTDTSECRLLRPGGSIVVVETIAARTQWQGHPAVHVVMWDVTKRRLIEDQLAWKATHDPLTGLANRRLLAARLDAMAEAGEVTTVLFVDLDDFKSVNDALGHEAGDQLLHHVARRLDGVVAAEDLVARLGGDEFVILLSGVTDPEKAELVVERVRHVVDEPFSVAGVIARIGASVGVTVGPASRGVSELVRAADRSMYRAKGRAIAAG